MIAYVLLISIVFLVGKPIAPYLCCQLYGAEADDGRGSWGKFDRMFG